LAFGIGLMQLHQGSRPESYLEFMQQAFELDGQKQTR